MYREGSSDSSADSSHADTATFVAQAQSLVQLYPVLQELANKQFKEFHDFSISCRLPLASVLISARKSCSNVERQRNLPFPELGTYLGSRVIKNCRSCKVYEHCMAFGQTME